MELVMFEESKPFVLEALGGGEFDYREAASEVFEADFFRFIKARAILDQLAESYPTPRKKEDVPFWFYVASNLSMRLHGVHAFDAFPMVVRCGGMLQAFGPKAGRKVVHPETGETTIFCEGFNQKNHYDRETPCDPDYLRKVAKDTEGQALMRWFGQDGVRVFQRQRTFDPGGLFIGDASYLFVPDNPRYEGSVKLLFDEHDHPVAEEQSHKMTDEQKIRCQWRRCYKMVTLLHLPTAGRHEPGVGVLPLCGGEGGFGQGPRISCALCLGETVCGDGGQRGHEETHPGSGFLGWEGDLRLQEEIRH
jgi:hypothetical protein